MDMWFDRVTPDGSETRLQRSLIAEVPVAIEINGLGYAVMMATPTDLKDFATGFVSAERLGTAVDVESHQAEQGVVLRVTLADTSTVIERVRHRTTDSSCGLCGIDNLEAALRPLPTVEAESAASSAAIFRAAATLRDHQPLNRETGAAHAAALCSAGGEIRLVREDVGRHNAFDKLVGAMARQELGWDGGFALISARCSFELVEKAVLAGCPLLAAISAPTALAAERARAAGLQLAALVRPDAMLRLVP
ncbi:formate dehydrogenase accessory sulfurtransferase FdhD [Sphingomonas sp.]|uniref:formate dehydrogenase accessory sulfurtransferase FdhD n=1 Tax=Sphingomonas sp. TaxID=28214 RepID=UPI0028A7F5E4|nr:formate dehydrogenase accessory sulfurtransferase FdhD [Sphingomonas sp.]